MIFRQFLYPETGCAAPPPGVTRESALARHDRMVLEEMEQAERVRSTADRPADFWQALAGRLVRPIEPFLRKLDAMATRHAALVVMRDPPQSPIAPFSSADGGLRKGR
jgi:hypothetical protein